VGKKFTRRDFLKRAAATGIGAYGAAGIPLEALAAEAAKSGSGKSRVVAVKCLGVLVDPKKNPSKLATTGMISVGEANPRINQAVLNSMLAVGVKAFAGTSSEAAAWKKLFKPSDVVGIKVNTLFGKSVSTGPEVVASVIAGLKLAGVSEENIIVWDRRDREMMKAGFRINRDGPGVRCYGTEGDYESQPTKIGKFSGKISKILTRKITALVNVPILKTHGIPGITCTMKNHYGSHNNPGDHHGNHCDPFLAELNSVPAIRDKTRLIVVDALRPLANGGPGMKAEFLWDYQSLLIGSDPVAIDYQGWQIIEARRKEIGLRTLAEAGGPTNFIATAASLRLGTNDPSKIELVSKRISV